MLEHKNEVFRYFKQWKVRIEIRLGRKLRNLEQIMVWNSANLGWMNFVKMRVSFITE